MSTKVRSLSTPRVHKHKEKVLRAQEKLKSQKDWLLWSTRLLFSEYSIPANTFVPISFLRLSPISSKDFHLSDFFSDNESLLSALNPADIEVAQLIDQGKITTMVRPRYL